MRLHCVSKTLPPNFFLTTEISEKLFTLRPVTREQRERDTGIGPKRSNDGYALDEMSDLVFNAVALC